MNLYFLTLTILFGAVPTFPTGYADIQPQAAEVSPSPSTPCPQGMVEIEWDYCPTVRQTCLRWVCPDGSPGCGPGKHFMNRCGEYQNPSVCLASKRVHKHFCIDQFEYPNVRGQVPRSWMSWYDADKTLKAEGKRICTNSEWTMACEGQDMHPLPYGNGYIRDRTACNFDNPLTLDVFKAKRPGDETAQRLDSMLVPSGSMSRCVSPYGIYDMPGNVDEWVINETGKPYVSGLKGGHIFGVRNACRPMTEAHGPTFSWYESSVRGCKSISNDRE